MADTHESPNEREHELERINRLLWILALASKDADIQQMAKDLLREKSSQQ